MVTACARFYDYSVSAVLSHTEQPVMTNALENAVKRTLPRGDWAWNTQADAVIAPLVAATLARWALLTFGSRVSTQKAVDPAFEEPVDANSFDEFDALSAAF